jgi:hypothetical protein
MSQRRGSADCRPSRPGPRTGSSTHCCPSRSARYGRRTPESGRKRYGRCGRSADLYFRSIDSLSKGRGGRLETGKAATRGLNNATRQLGRNCCPHSAIARQCKSWVRPAHRLASTRRRARRWTRISEASASDFRRSCASHRRTSTRSRNCGAHWRTTNETWPSCDNRQSMGATPPAFGAGMKSRGPVVFSPLNPK